MGMNAREGQWELEGVLYPSDWKAARYFDSEFEDKWMKWCNHNNIPSQRVMQIKHFPSDDEFGSTWCAKVLIEDKNGPIIIQGNVETSWRFVSAPPESMFWWRLVPKHEFTGSWT